MSLADVSSFQLLSSCCHNSLISNTRATEHNHVVHLHPQLPVACIIVNDAGTFKETHVQKVTVYTKFCVHHIQFTGLNL